MKKLLMLFWVAMMPMMAIAGPNPIVKRQSVAQITAHNTPEAVAYNYVSAILAKDFSLMESYMSKEPDVWEGFMSEITLHHSFPFTGYTNAFSTPGKLNILGWLPGLENGWELAVLYTIPYGYDDYWGEGYKVYVACVPSSEVGVKGFQDIRRYDPQTNAKVLIVHKNGVWSVLGFK